MGYSQRSNRNVYVNSMLFLIKLKILAFDWLISNSLFYNKFHTYIFIL